MSRISQIQQNNSEDKFDLGATFDNVFVSETNGYTLADLYEYLQNYFNNGTFVMYSENEPLNQLVKV
jgi:hypothetical protein